MIGCSKCKKAGRQERLTITGLMRETTGYPKRIEAEVTCACGARMWTRSMSVKRQASFVPGARIITAGERLAEKERRKR